MSEIERTIGYLRDTLPPGPYRIAGSKVSVDVGHIRVRSESASSTAEREAIAEAVAALPALLVLASMALVAFEPEDIEARLAEEAAEAVDALRRLGWPAEGAGGRP